MDEVYISSRTMLGNVKKVEVGGFADYTDSELEVHLQVENDSEVQTLRLGFR